MSKTTDDSDNKHDKILSTSAEAPAVEGTAKPVANGGETAAKKAGANGDKEDKDKDKDKGEEEEEDGSDEEDEEEDEDDDNDNEDEDEEPVKARGHGGHAAASHHHNEDDNEDDENLEDPYWWTPHAVMGTLVLIGVLGFFGAFNRLVGASPAVAVDNKPTSGAKAATATATAADSYGAKHLLVQYKGSMRAPPSVTRTEDEAKARATEAMNKAKAPGAKFEDVVKEYSDEPGAAQRGGDLGTFRKGQMVPEFQTAVETMRIGEISGLVKTPFGYHVILRTK